MMKAAQRGRLFAAGRRTETEEGPSGMLVDIEAVAVLGTFPGPALAVSDTGWVLSPSPRLPGPAAGLAGPLRWVRPTPVPRGAARR